MFSLEAFLDSVALDEYTIGLEHAFNELLTDFLARRRHIKQRKQVLVYTQVVVVALKMGQVTHTHTCSRITHIYCFIEEIQSIVAVARKP